MDANVNATRNARTILLAFSDCFPPVLVFLLCDFFVITVFIVAMLSPVLVSIELKASAIVCLTLTCGKCGQSIISIHADRVRYVQYNNYYGILLLNVGASHSTA